MDPIVNYQDHTMARAREHNCLVATIDVWHLDGDRERVTVQLPLSPARAHELIQLSADLTREAVEAAGEIVPAQCQLVRSTERERMKRCGVRLLEESR